MTAATTAARAPRAVSRARQAGVAISRLLARIAITAGLAVAAWLISLAFSTSASAAENPDADTGGGLLGGLVGGLTTTTANLAGDTLQAVDSTTQAVTKTLSSTVDTAADVVGSTLDTAGDTVGAVTGAVDDTVDAVTPKPSAPATAPAAGDTPTTQSAKASRAVQTRDAAKPAHPARAAARSDMPAPAPADRAAPLPKAVGGSNAAVGSGDGGSGHGGSKLPCAPASGAAAAASAADAAGKNPFATLPAGAGGFGLQAAGVAAVQPAAATATAAALPCTSPD